MNRCARYGHLWSTPSEVPKADSDLIDVYWACRREGCLKIVWDRMGSKCPSVMFRTPPPWLEGEKRTYIPGWRVYAGLVVIVLGITTLAWGLDWLWHWLT